MALSFAASAVAADPEWRLWAVAPDSITNGKPITIYGWIENVGDVPLSGNVTVTHTFSREISPLDPIIEGTFFGSSCQLINQASVCDINVDGLAPGGQVRFMYGGDANRPSPVPQGASGTLLDVIDVAGGGMPEGQSVQLPMTVDAVEPFAVKQFEMELTWPDARPAAQAGSTPDELVSTLLLRSVAVDPFATGAQSIIAPTGHLRDTVVHVPAGFVGNPSATPVKCTNQQLAEGSPQSGGQRIPNCPQNSQVGFVRILSSLGPDMVPLYNMVPPPGAPAAFGFIYQALTVVLVARLRPLDNGIDIVARAAVSSIPLPAVYVTMWGVPADSSHDHLRHLCMDRFKGNLDGRACPADAQPKPFLRMPTSCPGVALPWSADVTSHEDPFNPVFAATTTEHTIGCGALPFDPKLTLVPTDHAAHSATGLDAILTLPQDYGPLGLATADLRTATVTLPEGMTINPSSADGLKACSDADLKLRQEGPSLCPDGSKIGSVRLTTPLLDHPLTGSIILRTQNSDDPTSGELFRIAVEIRSDDDGVHIKMPGAVRADRDTGQLTTTFDDLPQLPFSSFQLHFKSGSRAPLASPRTCGLQTAGTQMTAWSEAIVADQSPFAIDSCGPRRFAPVFHAESDNPLVAKRTPFRISLDRDDADDLFAALTVDTPRGLLGRIRDATECSSADADKGTCPATSQIGTVTAGAGVGPEPFFITDGKAFLTGPYRGAPYGLATVVRALAGPFDLGTVVVRAAIHVDRHTAALHVVADRFPTVVKGVPLNLRTVEINVDKPGFMVTPTSCARKSVDATVTATTGAVARVSAPYQVANCRNIPFAPRLTLSVGGAGHTGARQSTPLTATLTQPPGRVSNIAGVKVALPGVLSALLPVVERACTQAQFDAGDCHRAEIGSAIAHSPLLPHALTGGAFFVKHPGQALPDMIVALRGDVSIDLVGTVQIPGGRRLATNFKNVPDAPIDRFTLRIRSGGNGPLGVAHNLCSRRARRATASVTMRGQNGTVIDRQQRLRIRGCGGAGHRR
ncbi:MAG TPA: hypothetical protein VF250_03475 [Conexibacter sp.]